MDTLGQPQVILEQAEINSSQSTEIAETMITEERVRSYKSIFYPDTPKEQFLPRMLEREKKAKVRSEQKGLVTIPPLEQLTGNAKKTEENVPEKNQKRRR